MIAILGIASLDMPLHQRPREARGVQTPQSLPAAVQMIKLLPRARWMLKKRHMT